MSCEALREWLDEGSRAELPSALAAHVQECPACRFLCAERAAPGGASSPGTEAGIREDQAVEGIVAALERDLQAERGLRARLRAAPTWLRRGVVMGLVGLLLALTLTSWGPLGLRADVQRLSAPHLIGEVGLLSALLIATLGLSLRPLSAPPLPRRLWLGLAGAALVTPFLLPLASPLEAQCSQGPFWPGALGCLGVGLSQALLVGGLVAFLSRASLLGRLLQASLGASLTGILVLSLHCPLADRWHLWVGHAALGVLLFAAVLVWGRWRGGRIV